MSEDSTKIKSAKDKDKFEDIVAFLLKEGLFVDGEFGPYDKGESERKLPNDNDTILLRQHPRNENTFFPDIVIKTKKYKNHQPFMVIHVDNGNITTNEISQIIEFGTNEIVASYIFIITPKSGKINKEIVSELENAGIGVLTLPFVDGIEIDELRDQMNWEIVPKIILSTDAETLKKDGDIRQSNVNYYITRLLKATSFMCGNVEINPDDFGTITLEELKEQISSIEEINEDDELEPESKPKTQVIKGDKKMKSQKTDELSIRIGEAVLTKFERARIVGARALQLSQGAPSLIALDQNDDLQPIDVAKEELKYRVLPLGIARRLPLGKTEIIEIQRLKDRESISDIDDIVLN
ncbi:MAG: DNA-directed RNA polymerase subunit K [Candidatus Heimdallarchaeota archaeon]|nr:DNA-directed RNA polymerase subunit K [Candidatus Heimdallarchaeota archaeon]